MILIIILLILIIVILILIKKGNIINILQKIEENIELGNIIINNDIKFKNEDLKILLDKGILFGSKAFKTNIETSDIDIAICEKDLPKFFNNSDIINHNINNYFLVQPKNEDCRLISKLLIKNKTYDILIFENPQRIKDIKSVVETMKKLPKNLLKNKQKRIKIFEMLLLESENWIIDKNSSKFKNSDLKKFEKLKKEINSILSKDINLIDNN